MPSFANVMSVAVVLLASSSLAAARDTSVALFNGKNLAGWTYHLEKSNVKPADVWSVKDGVLRVPAGKGKTSGKSGDDDVMGSRK